MQAKYPQKLTFNFIKQFSCEGQTVSFNELNLRKCLTIRLKLSASPTNPTLSLSEYNPLQGRSLLQILTDFANPTQVESLAILLRFSLDSEGDSSEEWCSQVLSCFLHSGHYLSSYEANNTQW